MPEKYEKVGYKSPGEVYTLAQAALYNMIVSIKCQHCRITKLFLATDLVKIFPPDRDVFTPHFSCSHCNNDDYMFVKVRQIDDGDVGMTQVRRLIGVRHIPVWRDRLIGDD